MPPVWIGLTLAFVSAVVTNTAYSLEHDAAARLPPLSPRRPFRSVQVLLRDRRWLVAFGAESAGWLMYVAALRLAPLALVQAVAASGVVVLAFRTARGHPSRLARREQVAVVLAVAGLVLLALSLVDTAESDQHPTALGIIVWLAACGAGAGLLIAIPTRFGRAASLGLAAGLLFADGDISAKLIGYGGVWLLALITLIVAYAIGTSVLQWAYQRGDALTAAGTATMVTNAVPIAAGFVLFGESLPHGGRAVLQVAAFACLVAGAVALGHQQVPPAAADAASRADTPASRADSPAPRPNSPATCADRPEPGPGALPPIGPGAVRVRRRRPRRAQHDVAEFGGHGHEQVHVQFRLRRGRDHAVRTTWRPSRRPSARWSRSTRTPARSNGTPRSRPRRTARPRSPTTSSSPPRSTVTCTRSTSAPARSC